MTTTDLIKAIQARKVIAFTICGLRCLAEPHTLGVGHDGRLRFTAFQTAGPSRIKNFNWMYEGVWALKDLEITEATFRPRPGYSPEDTRFQQVLETV